MDKLDNLFKACIYGDIKLLNGSFRNGGNLNKRYRKWKPIRWAIQSGHLNIVKALVDKGTNIKRAYSDGITPLEQAVGERHMPIIKYLISAGVDVNQKTANGTALHVACAYGQTEIVKILLQNGADLRIKDDYGKTPRHFSKDYKSVLKLVDKKLKTDKLTAESKE